MDIQKKIKELPDVSGVYMMKESDGKILYIGKASNIRKRVASYFHKKFVPSPRIAVIISKVKDIEYVPTTCEAEALILEASLIKRYNPKYNIALKDDKSYPCLKLTLSENYPRIFITRKIKDDGSAYVPLTKGETSPQKLAFGGGSRYFGPYTNARLLRQALYMIKRIFRLRTCNKLPKSVCLNYYLKQCLGPCVGEVDKARYAEAVEDLILFLEGKKDILLKELTKRMTSLAKEMKFEEATRIRDRIEALSAVVEGKVKFRFKDILEELKELFQLKKLPLRIDAFDVSNLCGTEAVGSMIAFYNMKFDKSSYRKFRIKTVKGIDDYKMIEEIIFRRYKRLLDEKSTLPDLVIIDGGKGHLVAAKSKLDSLGLSELPVMGIAKEFEHIYLPDKKDPIRLPSTSGILHIIQRIRDEAHRFAISYHRSLREKKSSYSELDEIKGIGEKRKRDLIKHFGTPENVKRARLDELLQVKGMTEKVAKNIVKYFKKAKKI